MITGTPAITCTLPIRKPGAALTALTIRAGAFGDARHPQPHLVGLDASVAPARLEHFARLGIDRQRHAEGLGDGIGGDVVVRRADAAGGEHIGVAGTQRVHGGDDVVLDIGDHPHFHQVDGEVGAEIGGGADIHILGAAGKDFVADDEERGGGVGVSRHGKPGRSKALLWRCLTATSDGRARGLPQAQGRTPSKSGADRLFLLLEDRIAMITYVDAETKSRRTSGVIPPAWRGGLQRHAQGRSADGRRRWTC